MIYAIVSPLKHEQRWFGGSPQAPPPPPPPPQQTDAEIQAEKAKTAKAARARKGRGASILTGETSTQFLQPDEGGGRKTLG